MQLARFQLSIVPDYELAVEPVAGADVFPCLRNMVAWARIDAESIPVPPDANQFGFAPRDYVDPRSGTTHSLLYRRP